MSKWISKVRLIISEIFLIKLILTTNTKDDEQYLDYSVSSDAGDDGSDSSSTNDDLANDPDTNDNLANSSDAGDDLANGSNMGHTSMSTSTNDEEHGHVLTNSEVTQSQGGLWVKPTVVHYPGNRAGEVCSEAITVMQEYENALGGPSENPYSPFSSQIDWELAKWAKLRGPSATSFTELLNISGVSLIGEPPGSIISPPPSSCMKNWMHHIRVQLGWTKKLTNYQHFALHFVKKRSQLMVKPSRFSTGMFLSALQRSMAAMALHHT